MLCAIEKVYRKKPMSLFLIPPLPSSCNMCIKLPKESVASPERRSSNS